MRLCPMPNHGPFRALLDGGGNLLDVDLLSGGRLPLVTNFHPLSPNYELVDPSLYLLTPRGKFQLAMFQIEVRQESPPTVAAKPLGTLNFLRYYFFNPWTENGAILVANISAPVPIFII